MNKKYKIGILGLGAVGGYIGGKLAAYYVHSAEIEIFFMVRPHSENLIREKGLKLITENNEQVVFPALVTSNPSSLGVLDLLICCVKSYHLEDALSGMHACISADTVIIPLQNGVDATQRIAQIFPHAKVLEGCIYLVSRLKEPAVVEQFGHVHTLYFGTDKYDTGSLKKFETMLNNAGIEAFLEKNINQICWEKFFFISTIATLTAYLDLSIGEILNNDQHKTQLIELMHELRAVSVKMGILLPENIIDKTMAKLMSLPFDATTSMHTDFKNGHQTEIRSLTEYVILLGREWKVSTPSYCEMVAGLKERAAVIR